MFIMLLVVVGEQECRLELPALEVVVEGEHLRVYQYSAEQSFPYMEIMVDLEQILAQLMRLAVVEVLIQPGLTSVVVQVVAEVAEDHHQYPIHQQRHQPITILFVVVAEEHQR